MLKFIRSLFSKKKVEAATDTEFCAEVVRVTEVLPHPNADRLELVKFDMATGPCSYQVVSGKGNFSPGDLAGYFSVDAILPLSRPEFAFLKERADGKDKDVYRLKAARLRGVFSQGLLVPVAGDRKVGDSLAKEFGVTYCPSAPDWTGSPHDVKKPVKVSKQCMPIYTVDSLKKLPNLFAPDELVTVTEKIHGTNMRFGWVSRRLFGIHIGYKFVVGSHRVIKSGTGVHWWREDLWTQAALRMGLKEISAKSKGNIFFGELYGYTYSGQKIQDLTYGRKPTNGPGLAIFDIKTPSGYMAPAQRLKVLDFLDLPDVPVFAVAEPYGVWAKSHNDIVEGKSAYDRMQVIEGVVIESETGPRKKAKYVGQAYLTRRSA